MKRQSLMHIIVITPVVHPDSADILPCSLWSVCTSLKNKHNVAVAILITTQFSLTDKFSGFWPEEIWDEI